MTKRVLLGTSGALLVALLLVMGWVGCHGRDVDVIDDTDLHLDAAADVSDDENGRMHLDKAAGLVIWPTEREDLVMDALNGDLEALAEVKDVIEPNAEALAMVPSVLQAPVFHVKHLKALEDDQPELVGWERLGQLLSLRALYVAKDDGLEDLFMALELGRRIETAEGGNLLHAMTGLEIRRNALTGFHTWIEMTPLARGESHAIARRLENYHTDAQGWARTWTAEYLALKGSMMDEFGEPNLDLITTEPGLLPLSFTYHPKRTLAGFAELYRVQAANGGRLCSRLAPVEVDRAESLMGLPVANAQGDRLLTAATPSLERFQYRRCAADTRVAAIQAMAGIRAYWDEHRDLPEELAALVPDYLDVVPHDPFDGEDLRWNLDHAWVYSVGDDFLDEDGRVSLVVDDLSEPTYRFLFCAGPFGERNRYTPASFRSGLPKARSPKRDRS